MLKIIVLFLINKAPTVNPVRFKRLFKCLPVQDSKKKIQVVQLKPT